MHELVKRALIFSLLSIAAILFLSVITRPTFTSKVTVDTLSIAVTIKALLHSYKSFTMLLADANSYPMTNTLTLLKLSNSPDLVSLIVPSIKAKEERLNITVIYRNELALSETLTYNVIVLPNSELSLSKDLKFSDKRVIIIHSNDHQLKVELVPYYNYTLRNNVLTVDLFLFKCKLKLKERMFARFLGYVEMITYLRSYESIGDVKVLLNSSKIIHEYAKVIIIKIHYEVWDIG